MRDNTRTDGALGEAMMQYLGDLEKHEIRQDYLTAWRQRWGGDAVHDIELTPLQSLVLSDPRAFMGPDLLVTGPPSSGKTFVAEALMAHILSHKSTARCFYLVPLRALVTEKTEAFRPIFGENAVVPASSDYREFDQIIQSNQFSICVAVYEKFFAWLADPNRIYELMRDCALIVIDELQMLNMPERGEKLDMILTLFRAQRKIINRTTSPMRFLGLAAQRDIVTPVRDWWDAQHLHSSRRPGPLFRGAILEHGYLPLRTDDATAMSTPRLPELDFLRLAQMPERTDTIVKRLVRHYVTDSKQKVLIFVSAKKYAQRLALSLASELGTSQAAAAKKLSAFEDTHARRLLAKTVPAGIAFHHSDLITEERSFVEQGFISNEEGSSINVVVATPTLGMGVNLPADVVLIVGARQFMHVNTLDGLLPDPGDPIPTRSLTPVEYRNMAGRAGRFLHRTIGELYGVCLLIQDEYTDQDLLLDLLEAPCPPLTSALFQPLAGPEPYVLTVLAWLHHRRRIERKDLIEIFRDTFAYVQSREKDREEWITQMLQALDRLVKREFVDGDTLGLRGIGREAAGTGISLFTLENLRLLLPRLPALITSPFALLYALTGVEELKLLYPWGQRFVGDPIRRQSIGQRLARFVDALGLLPPDFAANLYAVRQGDLTEVSRLVRTLALWHWMDGTPAPKIEGTGHCPALTRGDLHWLSDRMAWLLEIVCRMWLAETATLVSDTQANLMQAEFGQLARRVLYGVPVEVVQLAELRVSGWHRERLMELTLTSAWYTNEPQASRDIQHPLSSRLTGNLNHLLTAMRRRRLLTLQSTVTRRHIHQATKLSTDGTHLHSSLPDLMAAVYAATPQELPDVIQQVLKLVPLDLTIGEMTKVGTIELIVNGEKSARMVLLKNPLIASMENANEGKWPTSEQSSDPLGSVITVEALMQGCLEVLQQPVLAPHLQRVISDDNRPIITAEEMALLLKVLLKPSKRPKEPQSGLEKPPKSLLPDGMKRSSKQSIDEVIASAIQHPENIDQQILTARYLAERKNFEEAEKFLVSAIALDPHRIELKIRLATLLGQRGNVSEAEAMLWQLRDEYPHSHLPLLRLSQLFAEQQQYDDAVIVLEWVIEQGETLYEANDISRKELIRLFLTLSRLLARIGERKGAAELAIKGLRICGEDPALREVVLSPELTDDEWEGLQLGKVALGLSSLPEKEEDALRAAERAIALYPTHWRGYDARAFTLKRLGRTEEARAVWEQMLETDVPPKGRQRAEQSIANLARSQSSSEPIDKQVTASSVDSG